MGLPRHLPSGDPDPGHGPFGEKAFKRALIGCVLLVILGVVMMLVGGDAPRAVGTSFAVLGAVGLLTSGAGLLAERRLGRHSPPPASVRRGNGRGPYTAGGSTIDREP